MQAASAELSPQARDCPNCQARIPIYEAYVTWCEQCGWNMQPQQPAPPRNLFEALYAQMGQRSSRTMFEAVSSAPSLTPKLRWSTALALLLAFGVHLLTFAFGVLGIWLLVRGWPNLVYLIGAFLCGLLVWNIFPRFGTLPSNVLPRTKFPLLYQFADQVAQRVDAPSIQAIIIDNTFNAAFSKYGWRQQRVLYLGLPLFSVLGQQERVALLAHELAHDINGDPQRGLFIGAAIHALMQWHRILRPERIWEVGRSRSQGSLANSVYGIFITIWNVFSLVLAVIPWLCAYGLSHLLWRTSQRAEYLADYLAARTAGTDAMLAMLDTLHCTSAFQQAVQSATVGLERKNFFVALQTNIAAMPDRERERIRRVEQMQDSRLDRTHPPTAYRIGMLRSKPMMEPQLLFSPEANERLDQELSVLQPSIQQSLVEHYRSSLYR